MVKASLCPKPGGKKCPLCRPDHAVPVNPRHRGSCIGRIPVSGGISSCIVDKSEIAVTYIGMGGGGVGAAACRSDAAGVLRSRSDESGGGKVAGSTIWLPRMQRVLIGVDDTDTPEEGATWTLVHNIAKAVEDEQSVYLSHTIVQLFPVRTVQRTV